MAVEAGEGGKCRGAIAPGATLQEAALPVTRGRTYFVFSDIAVRYESVSAYKDTIINSLNYVSSTVDSGIFSMSVRTNCLLVQVHV